MAKKKERDSFFTLEYRVINGAKEAVRVLQEGKKIIADNEEQTKYYVYDLDSNVIKLVHGDTGIIVDVILNADKDLPIGTDINNITESEIVDIFKGRINSYSGNVKKEINEVLKEHNLTFEQIKDLKEIKE